MKVRISGGSDDIVSLDFDNGRSDEIYLKSDTGRKEVGYDVMPLKVMSIGGARGCTVYVIYDGCWSFSVGQLEEGRSLPNGWQFTVANEHAYSSSLTIEADEDLLVTYLKEDEK